MKILKNTWKNRTLVLMALPAIIFFIMFCYIPMFGIVLAFKDFNYVDGIWNSPWCGLQNFKFLFMVGDTAWRLTRNTVGYFILFRVTGTILDIALAICINEMVFKKLAKYFQSAMILPTFITYIAVAFIVEGFLKSETGIINRLIVAMGGENISFYFRPEYWPLILWIVNTWKSIGYGSVLYLSVLTGIDQELYDAASVDGASTWQRIRYISLPMLIPMVVIMTLLSLGNIMESGTGLYYQVTQNVGALYPTTQVLDSYVLNALTSSSNYGMTAAATFYQSAVGCIMVVGTNLIVRRYSPEHSLF